MQRLLFLRNFATEATSAHKLAVNLTVPHATLLKNVGATQVNLSSTDGDMGILSDHVPTVAELRPGLIEIIQPSGTKKFFVSGGFAVMNPDSSLNINAVEAVGLEDVDFDAARKALDEANRVLSSSSNETAKVDAKIQLEVLSALLASQK